MGNRKTIAVLLLFVAVTIATAVLLTPVSWPVGITAWVAMEILLLLAIVAWHARVTIYTCPNCNNVFRISAITDLVSPHGIEGVGWKYLRCPRCKQMVKASAKERG